ncbi:MAG: RNA methyltransferase, partial [Acidobacteria bacterium]|nr:RNA methyltransferase [Acidobacteriota bacterium]
AAAVLRDAEQHATLAAAIADCELVVGTTSLGHRELRHPLRPLEAGARLLRAGARSAPVALLFGSEKFGLSNEDLSYCHWLIRIASADPGRSMNLGQAVAVCLYELTRDSRRAVARGRKRPARSAELEQITALLLETLESSGYLNPRTAASTRAKVRRLVRRLAIGAADAPVLMGMLRQILWKLGEWAADQRR